MDKKGRVKKSEKQKKKLKTQADEFICPQDLLRWLDGVHRRKMSVHALLKTTRDLFRAMSLALRQKYPRNVVEMKEAMAAFSGSDSVEISCHCIGRNFDVSVFSREYSVLKLAKNRIGMV